MSVQCRATIIDRQVPQCNCSDGTVQAAQERLGLTAIPWQGKAQCTALHRCQAAHEFRRHVGHWHRVRLPCDPFRVPPAPDQVVVNPQLPISHSGATVESVEPVQDGGAGAVLDRTLLIVQPLHESGGVGGIVTKGQRVGVERKGAFASVAGEFVWSGLGQVCWGPSLLELGII